MALRFSSLVLAGLAVVPLCPLVGSADSGHESPRCYARVASELEDRVRAYESHAPAESELDARFLQLHDAIADEMQEDTVLSAACAKDEDLSPLRADLRASEARAYLMQSQITLQKLTKTCPEAANAGAAGLLAAAWRQLALSVPEGVPPPKTVVEASQAVAAFAAVIKLPLPSVTDATNYWMTQTQAAGRDAMAACPQ